MNGVLHHVRRHLAGWLALRAFLSALAVLGALSFAAVVADAAVDLPESLRMAGPALLVVAVVVVLLSGWLTWRRFTEMALAKSLEGRDAALGNRLSNAVDLAGRTGESPVQEFLRREAVELGRQTAAQQSAGRLLGRSVTRALLVVGINLLVWVALLLGASDLTRAVLPRFLDARGDHPPYSLLHLQVTPGAAAVLYGGQIEVRATAQGRPVDKLWLVQRTGTTESRSLMFLAPDKTFFQTLANAREPVEYWVTDGKARSKRFPVSVLKTPQIGEVVVTTEFPEYTGIPPHSGKMSEEAQALPEDSRVRFRVTSNRPLKSGVIELTPVLGGKTNTVVLEPEKTNGAVVSGSFNLTAAVAFTLSVRDTDGLASAENRRGQFNILADKPPRIFVLEPGKDAVATPTTHVAVRVQATDDYAVTRVAWLRGFNRSTGRPLNMKVTLQGGPQSVEAAGSFDMAKLGVKPGDVIDYYFEAADNYPKGPNVVFSRSFRLEIITQEQYEAVLRQYAARKDLFEAYRKNDAWLKRLAERARVAAAKAGKSDPTAHDDAAALAKQLEDYENALQKLLQQPPNFDVEQSFRGTLSDELATIEEMKKKLDQALGSGVLDPETLKKLTADLDALSNQEAQMVNVPAGEIANVAELLAAANAFVKLAQRQDALAQMLNRFVGIPVPMNRTQQMELDELAHQEHRTAADLRELLSQLPNLLDKVPEEPAYRQFRQDVNDFLKAIGELNIYKDLTDAAQFLDGQDTMLGQSVAAQAAAKMDQLIARIEPMGPEGDGALVLRFGPVLVKPGLGNTLAQILGAMGAGPGQGQGGQDGYGLFNEDVAMYGASAAAPPGGTGEAHDDNAANLARSTERVAGDAQEAGVGGSVAPGRVRLQPDAKFPLQYRDLVGEYFRAVAESEKEGN